MSKSYVIGCSIALALSIINLFYITYVDQRTQHPHQPNDQVQQNYRPNAGERDLMQKGVMEWPHQ